MEEQTENQTTTEHANLRRQFKRRSSSILKMVQPKVSLIDNDPNQKDSYKVPPFKKARKSESRRVSFADTCQVKEFPKDSPGSWHHDVKNTECNGDLDSTIQQEKKEITGLEKLLTGTIQNPNFISAEEEEMPLPDDLPRGVLIDPNNHTILVNEEMEMTACVGNLDCEPTDDFGDIKIEKKVVARSFLESLMSMNTRKNPEKRLEDVRITTPEKVFKRGFFDEDAETYLNTTVNRYSYNQIEDKNVSTTQHVIQDISKRKLNAQEIPKRSPLMCITQLQKNTSVTGSAMESTTDKICKPGHQIEFSHKSDPKNNPNHFLSSLTKDQNKNTQTNKHEKTIHFPDNDLDLTEVMDNTIQLNCEADKNIPNKVSSVASVCATTIPSICNSKVRCEDQTQIFDSGDGMEETKVLTGGIFSKEDNSFYDSEEAVKNFVFNPVMRFAEDEETKIFSKDNYMEETQVLDSSLWSTHAPLLPSNEGENDIETMKHSRQSSQTNMSAKEGISTEYKGQTTTNPHIDHHTRRSSNSVQTVQDMTLMNQTKLFVGNGGDMEETGILISKIKNRPTVGKNETQDLAKSHQDKTSVIQTQNLGDKKNDAENVTKSENSLSDGKNKIKSILKWCEDKTSADHTKLFRENDGYMEETNILTGNIENLPKCNTAENEATLTNCRFSVKSLVDCTNLFGADMEETNVLMSNVENIPSSGAVENDAVVKGTEVSVNYFDKPTVDHNSLLARDGNDIKETNVKHRCDTEKSDPGTLGEPKKSSHELLNKTKVFLEDTGNMEETSVTIISNVEHSPKLRPLPNMTKSPQFTKTTENLTADNTKFFLGENGNMEETNILTENQPALNTGKTVSVSDLKLLTNRKEEMTTGNHTKIFRGDSCNLEETAILTCHIEELPKLGTVKNFNPTKFITESYKSLDHTHYSGNEMEETKAVTGKIEELAELNKTVDNLYRIANEHSNAPGNDTKSLSTDSNIEETKALTGKISVADRMFPANGEEMKALTGEMTETDQVISTEKDELKAAASKMTELVQVSCVGNGIVDKSSNMQDVMFTDDSGKVGETGTLTEFVQLGNSFKGENKQGQNDEFTGNKCMLENETKGLQDLLNQDKQIQNVTALNTKTNDVQETLSPTAQSDNIHNCTLSSENGPSVQKLVFCGKMKLNKSIQDSETDGLLGISAIHNETTGILSRFAMESTGILDASSEQNDTLGILGRSTMEKDGGGILSSECKYGKETGKILNVSVVDNGTSGVLLNSSGYVNGDSPMDQGYPDNINTTLNSTSASMNTASLLAYPTDSTTVQLNKELKHEEKPQIEKQEMGRDEERPQMEKQEVNENEGKSQRTVQQLIQNEEKTQLEAGDLLQTSQYNHTTDKSAIELASMMENSQEDVVYDLYVIYNVLIQVKSLLKEDVWDVSNPVLSLCKYLQIIIPSWLKKSKGLDQIRKWRVSIIQETNIPFEDMESKMETCLVLKPKLDAHCNMSDLLHVEVEKKKKWLQDMDEAWEKDPPQLFSYVQTCTEKEKSELKEKIGSLIRMCTQLGKLEWKKVSMTAFAAELQGLKDGEEKLKNEAEFLIQSSSEIVENISLIDQELENLEKEILELENIKYPSSEDISEYKEISEMIKNKQSELKWLKEEEKELSCENQKLSLEYEKFKNQLKDVQATDIKEDTVQKLEDKADKIRYEIDLIHAMSGLGFDEKTLNEDEKVFKFDKGKLLLSIKQEDQILSVTLKSNVNSAAEDRVKLVHSIGIKMVEDLKLPTTYKCVQDFGKILDVVGGIVCQMRCLIQDLYMLELDNFIIYRSDGIEVHFFSEKLPRRVKLILKICGSIDTFLINTEYDVAVQFGDIREGDLLNQLHEVKTGPSYINRLCEAINLDSPPRDQSMCCICRLPKKIACSINKV